MERKRLEGKNLNWRKLDWKKLVKRALFWHPAATIFIICVAAALLIYSFAALEPTHPVSIASYVLSFYALVLACVRAPDVARMVGRVRRENRYVVRYTSDVRLRMNIALSGTFLFNAVYALFQLALGLWHRSVWFYAMAVYYALLAVMRLGLVRYTGRHAPGEMQTDEWKKYRFCGVCLLVMTLALMVFNLYFVWKIRVFRHHEITTIAMAAYTFASFTLAICNAIRYRRYGSPAYSAAKAVSLASAIVSMLTLENAMLTAFGQEESEVFRQIMLGATGGGVMLAVTGIAVYMIVHAHTALRQTRQSACEEKQE